MSRAMNGDGEIKESEERRMARDSRFMTREDRKKRRAFISLILPVLKECNPDMDFDIDYALSILDHVDKAQLKVMESMKKRKIVDPEFHHPPHPLKV